MRVLLPLALVTVDVGQRTNGGEGVEADLVKDHVKPIKRTFSTTTEKSPIHLGYLDLGCLDLGSLNPGSLDLGSLDPGSLDPGSLDLGSLDPGSLDLGSLDL